VSVHNPYLTADLARAVTNTGNPTVVVPSSAKPITEPWISEKASALVQQFYYLRRVEMLL